MNVRVDLAAPAFLSLEVEGATEAECVAKAQEMARTGSHDAEQLEHGTWDVIEVTEVDPETGVEP